VIGGQTMLLRRLLVIAFSIALCSQALADNAVRKFISVERGFEKFLQLDHPSKRVSTGSSNIVDVSLIDDSTLRILGLAPGRTTLSIWQDGATLPTTYEVVVTPDVATIREQFRKDKNLSEARLSVNGDKVVLDGQFKDAASQDKARKLATYLSGSTILDLSEVDSDEVVQVEVQFATIARSTLDALGLNFSRLGDQISVATAAPNTLRSFALNANGTKGFDVASAVPLANAFSLLLASPDSNILAAISALQSNDLAKTLAEPTLVVRSGEKADFLVGGEIPIPVPQGGTTNAITIEYKRFGVHLEVAPTILKDRRIALTIHPEVSELDFSNAVTLEGFTIPALRSRSTQTTVEVNENQTLVLAGLTFLTNGAVIEKIPYLGDVPILGKLFQRTQKSHERQELIVVVTPRLVTSSSQKQTMSGSLQGLIDESRTSEDAGDTGRTGKKAEGAEP